MKFNYVFFNSYDHPRKLDSNGYYSICIEDLYKLKNVNVVPFPLYNFSYLTRVLYSLHNSPRINKICELPFKEKWFQFIFKNTFDNTKPICFVICNYYIKPDYVRYLRKTYPKCKVVRIYRDLQKVAQVCSPEWTEILTNELIDLRMTYDPVEAQTLGLEYFSEFESRIDGLIENQKFSTSDVFFAGKAKDRLSKILSVYEILTESGLKCDFYLTDVPLQNRKYPESINYLEKPMTYRTMLEKTMSSNVILEINQGGASGYTSRFLEAVMYNKLLITNNPYIKNSKFYNDKYIYYFDQIDEGMVNFIRENSLESIDYKYKNEFSPIKLIEKIDNILKY